MKVVAANGRAYTAKMLRAAVKAAKGAGPAVELIVVHDDFFRTVRLDEHGGLRYPMLVRIPGTPDLLSSVFAPHAGGGH
ncbi:MAG: hypothetical protein HY076_02135 [Candidatus Eisenbacteria bacterium]|uniref:Uncharacterized protein n=1 Tax=Eiseniibacteriota bacterium TaxID=2212470 RepID=A0A9D6L5L6_UNCEI|nr:hypothetical protein [Candidatus Eisenbacteria bacterium]